MSRLLMCFESASLWADELPRYATRQKRNANIWALVSGVAASITALTIWPLISENAELWAKLIVSSLAFITAISALVPKVLRYSEMAERGQELASEYGRALGLLTDLVTAKGAIDQKRARKAVEVFGLAKTRKDRLEHLPRRKRALKRLTIDEENDFETRFSRAHKLAEAARKAAWELPNPPRTGPAKESENRKKDRSAVP